MKPPDEVLSTNRLYLRRLTLQDLDALAALYADPETRQYYPDKTLTRDQTRAELEWFINVHYARYGFGLWATILKETHGFIGRCGLLAWQLDGVPEVEVAYLIDKRYQGQGLATEAATAIQAYGFAYLDVPRLISLIDPDNQASVRVAQKTGMTLYKAVDGIDGDNIPTLIYSVTREAYKANLQRKAHH